MLRLKHLRWAPLAAVPVGIAAVTTINDEVCVVFCAGNSVPLAFLTSATYDVRPRERTTNLHCSVACAVGQRATSIKATTVDRAKREAADLGHGMGGTGVPSPCAPGQL